MQKTFTRATASILVIGFLALVVLVVTYNSNIAVGAGYYGSNSQSPTVSLGVQGIVKNAIQLSAKLDNSVNPPFRWVNPTSGVINPTLNFKANTNQTIQIQNPTDFKHQFIIDQNGKQLATSGDIAAGSSGQVSFKSNMIGTFGYHCLYHPTTMKGIIQVH
jgi:Cupredoxin-like domain